MYLTAHFIKTDRGGEAINAFLHDDKDVTIGAMCDAEPGGHGVLSYLDLWFPAPIELRLDELKSVVEEASKQLAKSGDVPFRMSVKDVTLGFGCTYGVHREGKFIDHFDHLAKKAMTLATEPNHWSEWLRRDPFTILVSQKGDHVLFTTDADSRKRLTHMHGKDWLPKTLTIDSVVLSDMDTIRGQIYPDLIQTLTDISMDEISHYGGIVFKTSPEAQTIWSYP